jgi:two-component system, chemotaxis family, CheB/CheR fusion protein
MKTLSNQAIINHRSAIPPPSGAPPPQKRPLFPVVGIGASAGGLEALELFLHHTPPNTGMAFVIIQHLSPDHVGMLPELLQRITTMKVMQAKDGVQVKPNCVYVIPPNKGMSIRNRALHLYEPVEIRGLRLPIDLFLRSLAVDCAEQSIGIVLSGMGSDGTLGLRTIKEQSGLTLVQEPASAKFDSMPGSAIEAGVADIIAPPEELTARIIDYLQRVLPLRTTEQELADKDQDQDSFAKITALLREKTKQDFSLYKPSSIKRRIERRMGIHKIDSTAGYASFLQQNPHEVDLLFKELLIGVTSFFRDPDSWEELKTETVQKILTLYPEGGALRAWSCGCSTGEEPYSLAMLFREALEQVDQPERYTLQIFATDLDSDAIEKARKGLYSASITADVSPERLQRFFTTEDNQYKICREIREMVTFARQNVIMDPPFTKLDILICRNLLIYLTTDLQQKLFHIFHYSLKPGSLLFLGSAETVGAQSDLFPALATRSKLFQRSQLTIRNELITIPSSCTSNSPAALPRETLMLKTTSNLQVLADNFILQHFSSPTVLVNTQGDIVYISGRTGKYLEPAVGKANLNIFAMAREGLRYELGSAFGKALQQYEPITVRASLAEVNSIVQAVELTLIKIEAPDLLRDMIMIAFKDLELPPKQRRRRPGMAPDSKQVEQLEQELQKNREDLRATHEEMQASHEEQKSMNEELQSTNEELQSTNEELTTSKEEMQSMNEELQTVNAEQTARLDEFTRLNNDMENLLNSTEIVTIFLDNQLQVRRFTTGANRLFKLIPGDIGRPLTDIVSNLEYPQLYDHVQDVLKKLVSVEHQAPTTDGRWYLVRIMPYRTMEKMIDGVVITCNDITVAKTVEETLRKEIDRLNGQISI